MDFEALFFIPSELGHEEIERSQVRGALAELWHEFGDGALGLREQEVGCSESEWQDLGICS